MVKQLDIVQETLSPLESAILEAIWQTGGGESKVRDIYQKIKDKNPCAQTSVAVTLDRLYQRKLVGRKITTGRGGLSYIYFAQMTKEEYGKATVKEAVDRLVERFGSAAVAYFNEKYQK
ncbi:BlaI/MecI/CopY family transcriptional regulator [Candidatus Micrarchaeota archaeon]|nr:BlaI/MecI/CopY family transcriptional regulator [Candidatus Micrarchaeota archaeon]